MTSSPPPDRRAIGVVGAFVEGWRRVLQAPAVWMGLLAVGVFSASTPAMAVGARSFWMPSGARPFADEATRAAAHLGFAIPHLIDPSTLIVDVLQTARLPALIDAGFVSQTVVWIFLWGGVLDRLARARPVGSAAFFGACGGYLWRFLRLAVPIMIAYWAIDSTLEVFSVVELVALVALLMIADFARVRMVVEDRRSMLGGFVASMRFIRRNFLPVVALTLLNLAVFLALNAIISLIGSTESAAALPAWAQTGRGLVMMLVALFGRLAFPASEIAFFQSRLAHANYTAAPLPIWPDSPAAEAIENLVQERGRSEA